MEQLADFILREGERYADTDAERFRASFSQLTRYLEYLRLILKRYETADAAAAEDVGREVEGSGFEPPTREARAEEKPSIEASSLALEIESFHLFARLLLDQASRDVELYFGPAGTRLASHDDLVKNLDAYAGERGLALSSQLMETARTLNREIDPLRESGMREPVQTPSLRPLSGAIDAYLVQLIDFFRANAARTGLRLKGAESARRDGVSGDAILDRLVQWAESEDAVRALILTSSRAADAARDLFSDYDVIVVVEDVRAFLAESDWLEKFGRVLVVYRDPIQKELGCEMWRSVTQYEDGTKIDFTLWPRELLEKTVQAPALPDELDVGYRVLLDKDERARDLKPATQRAYIPAPPTEADFRNRVEEFFHESTYVAKHLWRGDLLPAKYNLDHAMKQIHLRRMLEWRIEIDEDWSFRPGAYGRGLQERLSPDLWAELEATYVGAGVEENWDALFATVALFQKVAGSVATTLGYTYPSDLDERVTAYLMRVRGLPQGADQFPS